MTPEESMLEGDQLIETMAQFVTSKGFSFLAVVLGRQFDLDGNRHQPTSSALYCQNGHAHAPGYPSIARQLREMADQLDAAFVRHGTPEAEHSTLEVLVNEFAPAKEGGEP